MSNCGNFKLIRPDMLGRWSRARVTLTQRSSPVPPPFTECTMSSDRQPPKPEQGQESSQPLRSHKSMTKAERRELQEKQRAAKAAAKASGSTGQANKPASKQPEGGGEKSSGKQSGKQGSGPSTHSHTQHQRRGSRVSGIGISGEIPRPGGGPGGNIASDLASRSINPRGVRIFSHFGLQQKSGTGKGLIHPAIVRLGLLFSDFQITGANARCLATLIAFKHVRVSRLLVTYHPSWG
jgi:translation initiation factor eIF-2B subunit delta